MVTSGCCHAHPCGGHALCSFELNDNTDSALNLPSMRSLHPGTAQWAMRTAHAGAGAYTF